MKCTHKATSHQPHRIPLFFTDLNLQFERLDKAGPFMVAARRVGRPSPTLGLEYLS